MHQLNAQEIAMVSGGGFITAGITGVALHLAFPQTILLLQENITPLMNQHYPFLSQYVPIISEGLAAMGMGMICYGIGHFFF